MSALARTSLLAVLALVAGLLGIIPAHAAPAGTITLASGTSGTPTRIDPLARTAAGVVYRVDDDYGAVWIRPTGGTAAREGRMTYPTTVGDILSSYDYNARTLTWRTIADPTLGTVTFPAGLTYLTRTATGYVAQRGTGPYELVKVELSNGATTVFGTSATAFNSAQAGPLGAVFPNPSVPTEQRYFPYSSVGTGQVITTPVYSNCTVTSTHLYCVYYDTARRLSRLPLTGAAGTTIDVDARNVAPTSTGVAIVAYVGPATPTASSYVLQTWATSSATPTTRLDRSFLLEGTMAATTNTPGTVLVSRGGPLGQAGIWAVPVATGAPTAEVVAPAQPRMATMVAVGPGLVAWSDNQSHDGSIWARDLSTGTGGLAAGTPRLVATNATGSTLSLSGDRLTYSVGSRSFGPTALDDSGTVQQVTASGRVAALSGDRLLLEAGVNAESVWSLRDLRTGQVTSLPAAMDYDLWGERLAHLNSDGSVWVRNLRTGAAAVQVRAPGASADGFYGRVQVAGDVIAWEVSRWDFGTGTSITDISTRNLATMAAATAVPALDNIHDLSTGYIVGMDCPTDCNLRAVRLADGQITPLENSTMYQAAVDGSTVAFLSAGKLPSVFALPAYTDQPRLLGSPGAAATLAAGGTWTARVVASRVLSSCAVEIRTSTDVLVRTLSCTDAHAATTVTWDGKNASGAVVPDGQYRWRLVGAVDGLPLVDYDGSTTALSGTIAVSGASGAPTVTARTPLENATGVAVAGNVTATFSEPVQGVNGTTFTLRNAAGTAIPAAVSYNATTRVATLNPGANLPADGKYTATLTGGAAAIRDATGTALATQSWTFTAGPAPTVTARTPASNGTSVGLAANVTATFSEAVQGVSGTTFTLTNAAGTAVPAAVSYNATTRVATLNPTANLTADTRYTATLTGGPSAVRDAAGNGVTTQSWAFTSGPAPTVTARTPALNATGVARAANTTATFSEPVQGISTTTANLKNPAGATIAATVTYNATTRVATIDPSTSLAAATKYTVTLTGGAAAIRDLAGNPLATVRWTFTTGAS